jgi:AbrB family looped-hinge helix DNA binding protein
MTERATSSKPAKTRSVRVHVAEGGRIVIPAAFRKALGIKPGDSVTVDCIDGELRVRGRAAGILRAQQLASKYVDGTPSMSEELTAERRAESASE